VVSVRSLAGNMLICGVQQKTTKRAEAVYRTLAQNRRSCSPRVFWVFIVAFFGQNIARLTEEVA
jgi:hypothetical protein